MDPETFQVQRIAFLWAGLGWLGLVTWYPHYLTYRTDLSWRRGYQASQMVTHHRHHIGALYCFI